MIVNFLSTVMTLWLYKENIFLEMHAKYVGVKLYLGFA